MRNETVIGAKLAARGIFAHNVKFQLAIAEFQNNGGEYGVALAMLNAAYGRGSQGQWVAADKAEERMPSAPPQNAAKGQGHRADKAVSRLPDAAPKRSAGRTVDAQMAIPALPDASSRHKPGHAKRGAAAISSIQAAPRKVMTPFDTVILPDGRMASDVQWQQAPGVASKYRRVSRILMAGHGFAIPVDPATRLGDMVPVDEQERIISAVERINDIH